MENVSSLWWDEFHPTGATALSEGSPYVLSGDERLVTFRMLVGNVVDELARLRVARTDTSSFRLAGE